MKIYLVASTTPSWMNTGYGHSLLAGDHPSLLVSFVEHMNNPNQQLKVTTMAETYQPSKIMRRPVTAHRSINQPIEEFPNV